MTRTVTPRFLLALLLTILFTSNRTYAQCDGAEVVIVDYSHAVCTAPKQHMVFTTTNNYLNQEAVMVYDYTLPKSLNGQVKIAAKGGNGGKASISCYNNQNATGGIGAYVSGTINIGIGPGMVPPGSTLRYVLGEAGQESTDFYTGDFKVRGGSGGGSTGILYKEPDSTSWKVLMVAGGGGGGIAECRQGFALGFIYYLIENAQNGDNGVMPNLNYWYGGGGISLGLHAGGGGGGILGNGQDPPVCPTGCVGGQGGTHWLTDDIHYPHKMYKASGVSCIGLQSRLGGRGFTGGGAGASHEDFAGSGGGGGIEGGESGGRDMYDTLARAHGGRSAYNASVVTLIKAKVDTTGYLNGYADFEYIPDSVSLGMVARLDILPTAPAPFCDSALVTYVARPVYRDGRRTDGFTNLVNNSPVYRWSVNGVQVATGQNYADSTFNLRYVPGDIVWCQFWAKDTGSCNVTTMPVGAVTLPVRNLPAPTTNVTITAVPGTTVCETKVYDQYGGYNLEAWATYKATSSYVPKPYSAGNGNYMYVDTSFTAQQIALQACEAEYGIGNCSLGTSTFYCTKRPAYNNIDSLYSGLMPNTNYDNIYFNVPTPKPIAVTSNSCNAYSYYYRTGISQTSPDYNSHQFVFAASSGVTGVNEDLSNGIIADSGSLIRRRFKYWNEEGDMVYHYDTSQFNQTNIMKYPTRYGTSTTGKFPFVRTYKNDHWELGETNLGTTLYSGNVEHTYSYKWFRNGYVQGTGHSYVDGNGVTHLDTIPFTSDTLWVRNVSEGEVVTCQVNSNHCPAYNNSNTLTMHVDQPSTGGVITGPQHPCPNINMTYWINGANNALNYVWIIEGDATNVIGNHTYRNFNIGEDTVWITCMPIGPCGRGDTIRYVVAPGTITNEPCTPKQLLVNTNGVRCEGIPKAANISIYGTGGCYQWSTGAKTPTITVYEDGDYFVYVDGCKSEVVTISSQSVQHPAVSIAINPPPPGQETAWCRSNNFRSMSATVSNYTGNPNISYQWYRNGAPHSTQSGGLYLDLNLLNSYDTIQCKITLDEQCAIPVWSNKIVLPEISSNSPLGLGANISAPQGCSGDTITFTALPANAGSNPTYTWRVNSNFASDTDAVFERAFVTNVEYPVTYTVYLTVFASPLTCRTGSDIKQISFPYTVYPKVTPAVNISAENTAVCPNDSITFNAIAENGGAAPVYQWYKNNIAVGTNSASYTASTVANGDSVYCLFSNTDNTYCIAAPDKSNVLAAKVYTPLSPLPSANPGLICLNDSTHLSATVNPQPGDFTYQGFGGIFAPSQWTINRGCMGEITTTQAPTLVDISVLHPPYGPSFSTCNNEMIIAMPVTGTVSFDWAYRLLANSYSIEDVPLVFVDGVEYRFPEIDYSLPQTANKTGHFSVLVQQGQILTLRQKGKIYETANQSQYIGSVTTFYNFKVQTQPSIKWYDAVQNGNLIGTGNTIAVSPTAAGVTNYYAEAANTNAGCSLRTPVAVTARPPSTTVKSMIMCGSYTWINGVTYTASTDTPTHVLTDQLGCDSILNLQLTILQPTTSTDVQTACGSYTWIDGNTYTTSNNTATHIITNSLGCDSIITLSLTINNATTGTDVVSACESYTWIDGNTYTASNSTATHILTAANGCDSVVTLNLTIKTPTTGTDVVSACESYTWIDGNTYIASNNTATHTIAGGSVTGCDSVVTLNLTIKTPTTGTDVISACGSYTWIDGNTYTASNNTATHTLTGANGCDSVVTLNLTIKTPTTGTDVVSACESYTWIDGNTYTASNSTATHILTGVNGCDSVVTLNLTIKTPTTGTDVVSACESYTWIDGNTYIASNNTATHTIAGGSVTGCDSVVTLNLTVKTPTTGTDVVSACESYTWIDGVTYTANNASATHTLTGANGCDSVVTLNLTIKTPTTSTDVVSACESYTWIDGNTYTANNSTATYTLTGANGCDSVVTLNLTIKTPTTSTDVVSACESYTWIDGNTYTASNNTATHTLTGANGCDSVVTLNLSIKTPTTGTDVVSACESYTWIDGNTYTASNNTATHTLTATNGCDSVVTLNLTIKTPTTGTDVVSACESYMWIDGNTYTASNNTATHTIVGGSVNGCDSVVTLNLTIKTPTTGTDVVSACESYTWIDGNIYTASNSTATHTLTGVNGCDSVVTLSLTIEQSTINSISHSICTGDSYNFNGTMLNAAGVYTDTLASANSCDSIVVLNLNVWSLPTQPVITQIGDTLICTPATATYNWYLNGNGVNPIFNNHPLGIDQTGSYEVEIVDSNGCTNRSEILNVTVVGIRDLNLSYDVKLYPNPSNGTFSISFSDMVTREIYITDMSGRLVMSNVKVSDIHTIDMDVAEGMYILSVNQSGTIRNIRFSVLK